MDWISVNDFLPDDDTTVMIWTDDEPWLGYHDVDEDGACWRNVDGARIKVTHWAAMPAGPK